MGVDRTSVSSNDKLPPGKYSIVLTFKYEGGGIGKGGHVSFKFAGTINNVVINLGEAALTPQEQKELDHREGANELID